MDIRLLGPVELKADGAPVLLRRRQERALLAILALERGRLVPVERLVELLWEREPSPQARSTIHALVSRLRSALRPTAARLVTRGAGYALEVPEETVDVDRFRALVDHSRAAASTRERADLLRAALDLWRGPALADAIGEEHRRRVCAELDELHLVAQEEWLEAGLELGEHRSLVGQLSELVDRHPLRERLVWLLMLALHRAGRKTDALEVYQALSQRLRDELGLDPGSALQQLRTAILRDDAELGQPEAVHAARTGVRPAQLPARAGHFTGRDQDLGLLDELLGDDDRAPAVVISAIGGSAGVGKTALAVQWAHRIRDRFPDGQLFVNLRGYLSGPPLRPIEALAQFLRALGVAPAQVPLELDEAASMYRTLLADRRALVVLDNAHSAEQVRPLLPGSPGCLVVVTSRNRLAGLVAKEGAHRLTLGVLAPDEAIGLLSRILGARRVADEPDALAALARLCAYLPLALRIAAANLLDHPAQRIEDFVAQLSKAQLAGLAVEGDEEAAVRGAFDVSYTKLDAGTRRMFRLLGLLPGPDVSAAAAAALAGAQADQAQVWLDRLVSAHLVEERAPSRYTFHDLLRRYAADRVGLDDFAEREAAERRLSDWYLAGVDAAARVVYPQMARLPVPADLPEMRYEDDTAGMAWLEAERANLVAAVVRAADDGPRQYAWRLGDALRGYFWLRRYGVDWQTVAQCALSAARAEGEVAGEAAAELSLANIDWSLGRARQAVEHCERALPLAHASGWRLGESAALNNLGSLYTELGDSERAIDSLNAALAIDRQLGWHAGMAMRLSNLGVAHEQLGRIELAASLYAEALEVYREIGSRDGQAQAEQHLGIAHRLLGRLEPAIAELTAVLSVYQEIGNRYGEAYCQADLADAYRDAGRYEEARAAATAAISLAGEIGDLRAQSGGLHGLASAEHRLGRHREALAGFEQVLRLAREGGNRYGEADALIGLAAAGQHLGDPAQALAHAEAAVALTREARLRPVEGEALAVLAEIQLKLGRVESAASTAEQALRVHRETGQRLREAEVLVLLGVAEQRCGRAAEAADRWRAALTLFTEVGSPEADRVRLLLSSSRLPDTVG